MVDEYTRRRDRFTYLRARYYDPATGQFLSLVRAELGGRFSSTIGVRRPHPF